MSSESNTRSLRLATEADTLALGEALGRMLRAGDLVLLDGALGAGKTVLTRGIATGMGVAGRITSPTFVLAREHHRAEGSGPSLVHVDAYRLTSMTELDDLDLDTDLAEAAVVVEWGEGFAERLGEDHLLVTLRREPDDVREVSLRPRGREWQARLDTVTADFA